jgi:hypothetical protein
MSCGAEVRTATEDSTHAGQRSSATTALPSDSDGLGCETEEGDVPIAIVSTTQRLPVTTPEQEAGWANVLPTPAAPLLADLRALNRQPPLTLDPAGLAIGRPVTVVPPAVAAPTLWPSEPTPTTQAPLLWFSRVAYTADGKWSLVYVAQVCSGVTPAMVPEAEPGAYQVVFLAALEDRSGKWEVR